MAKQTREPSKKAPVSNPVIPEIPVRITVEVVIRHEYPTQPRTHLLHSMSEAAEAGCPENKFSYSFDKANASVLSLIVEEFEKDNPEDSGEFTTCINDPAASPRVMVIGLAKEDNAGGRVALTLKFRGKDLFTTPKEFTRTSNGFLKFNELVKIPV